MPMCSRWRARSAYRSSSISSATISVLKCWTLPAPGYCDPATNIFTVWGSTTRHVSICAPIDMAMGHGLPAIQGALDQGFRPSLSSDHGVAIAQDFFSVIRSTYTLQRLLVLQRARKGEQNLPPLLSCRDMLEFGTIAGARCANLDGKVG